MGTAISELRIDGGRLWADLQELGAIGATPRGINRVAYSPEDMAGRAWLLRKMREVEMTARIDGVGNVFGRLEGTDDLSDGPAIMIGSHIDTVPDGGRFDGALGVLGGLECARALVEGGVRLCHPLEVAAFANEEGTIMGSGTFGSRVYTERATREQIQELEPSVRGAGITGDPRVFSEGELLAYLELHVEQGGVLDACGQDIGVVLGIVGINSFSARFVGMANHAGTTPMSHRRDALLGAARFITEVPAYVRDLGTESTVGTCGRVIVLPGGRNVIPGDVEVSVEVRDMDDDVSRRVVEALRRRVSSIGQEHGLRASAAVASLMPSCPLNPHIIDAIAGSARGLGLSFRKMPSGAAHDCMNLAARGVPSGMIFVPSKDGISHSPSEWTDPGQCETGANVLLRTLLHLDGKSP